jgi:hypothetical protein
LKNVKYFFFIPKKDIQASGEASSQRESSSNMKFYRPFLVTILAVEDTDPDPAFFVLDLQDAKKQLFYSSKFFAY